MKPETFRLASLLNGFFISKQAEGCSPKTIADYRCGFAHFGRWSEAQGKTNPTKITPQDVKAFLADLRTKPNGRGQLLAKAKLSPEMPTVGYSLVTLAYPQADPVER